MSSIRVKNTCVSAALMVAVLFFMFSRINSAYVSKDVTIDENVYDVLGFQLKKNLRHYDLREYTKKFFKINERHLDKDYFTAPLFKHPPLYPSFIAVMATMTGGDQYSGVYVSVLFGALMILLTYLLGAYLFDRNTALLGALLLCFDPVLGVSSQKSWMEVTLSFLILLSVALYIVGIHSKRSHYFIWSGLACGLACLTKYTGILPCIIFGSYACFCHRSLFKNISFVLSLILPGLMLIPWFYWNYTFYGPSFINVQLELHEVPYTLSQLNLSYLHLSILFLMGYFLILCFTKDKSLSVLSRWIPQNEWAGIWQKVKILALLAIGLVMWRGLIKSFLVGHIPESSWGPNPFAGAGKLFYIERLLEFSPFYILGIYALVFGNKQSEDLLLRYSASFILVFYILYGSYQSRYILSALPFILILSAHVYISFGRWVFRQKNGGVQFFGKAFLFLFLAIAGVKNYNLFIHFIYPNFMCYF